MPASFTEDAKLVRKYLYDQFLATGRCPNTVAIMRGTALSKNAVDDALVALERGVMVMLERDTDHNVIKCPPWSNFPTPHLMEVDGVQKWYAGCALEAINYPYMHPGKPVRILTSCPHCGEEMMISLLDDKIVGYDAEGLVLHIGVNPLHWNDNWIKGCANNNFFPSMDHVREWEKQHPELTGAAVPILKARALSNYRNRFDYDRGPDSGIGREAVVISKLREAGATIPSHWQ